MKISLIRIGNSKGFRIPKSILERYEITQDVELILEEEQIVLRPVSAPRKGWDESFNKMHEKGDDQSLIDDVFDDENFEEWD